MSDFDLIVPLGRVADPDPNPDPVGIKTFFIGSGKFSPDPDPIGTVLWQCKVVKTKKFFF